MPEDEGTDPNDTIGVEPASADVLPVTEGDGTLIIPPRM